MTEVLSNAVSNYNGLTASVIHRSKSLLLQFNYSWSHALDEISNGGILGFNAGQSALAPTDPYNLAYNYGNADYDFAEQFYRQLRLLRSLLARTSCCNRRLAAHGHGLPPQRFPVHVNYNGVTNQIANYPSGNVQIFAQQLRNVPHCGSSAVFNTRP